MECCKGLLTAFGLGFTPPSQCKARPDLRLRPHPVDTLLPLAIAPVAPLHGMGCCWQQLVLTKRQGFFPGRRKELLARLAHLGEPQEPTSQFGPLVPSRLGPTASIKQGRDLFPTHTQHVDVGQPTGEAPPPLAFGLAHVTLDAQIPRSAQRRTLRVQPLFRAGSLLGHLCARTAPGSLGLLSRPALPLAGHRLHHRLDDILAAMKLAQVMGPPAQDRGAGGGESGTHQRWSCPAASSPALPRPFAADPERPGCPRGWDRASAFSN
jgi:hypothetical protein